MAVEIFQFIEKYNRLPLDVPPKASTLPEEVKAAEFKKEKKEAASARQQGRSPLRRKLSKEQKKTGIKNPLKSGLIQ